MYQLIRLVFALPFVALTYYFLRRLIGGRRLRNLLTAFFVLIVFGYPLADALSRRSVDGWTRNLVTLGFYCLPFVLYLGPIAILSELVIWLLRRSNCISADALNRPAWRAGRFWLPMILPAVIVCVGAVNNTRLVVREYSVAIPRKSSTLRHLKIVFASDFHLGQFTEENLVLRFAERVNAQNPDIVLIGGDVQGGDLPGEDLDRFSEHFRRIQSKYGVYAVTGNHDIRAGVNAEFFARSGMKLLRDSVEKIDEALYLVGRDDRLSGTRKPTADLVRDIQENLPIVLVDHRPEDLEGVSRTRVDLQLSGHTHDWQFFPLNLIPSEEFQLSWGYLKNRETQFIVTSGVELTRPPVRTAGLSEILVINVQFRDNAGAASRDLSTHGKLGQSVH